MVAVRSISLVFAVAALAYSAPTLADPVGTTSPTAAATSTAAVPGPNDIVCRAFDPPTGTRLGSRRVCQTQKQWDDQQQQAQDQLHSTQRQIITAGQPGG